MRINNRLTGILAVVLITVVAVLGYRRWSLHDSGGARNEMLALLPDDPSVVVFVDLGQFRSSAFLSQLLAWAPYAPVDEEYAQFVQASGFNYERDLDRVSMAFSRQPAGGFVYGVADGRFDRKKIEEYAMRSGEKITGSTANNNSAIFSLKSKNSTRASYFTFVRDDRIAWTNAPSFASFFESKQPSARNDEWKEHFARLSGSSLFAVVRQDSATAAAMAQQAPGGFRSPQMASLLNQLEWITAGAKPDGDILRVVLEGECPTETAIHQLKDFLSGLFLLAQVGLNGPQNRKQLDPRLREAYLEMLKSANVEEVDRGPAKSVRVVFEVTPGFLDAVRTANAKENPGAR
jgi:hypothetical protein